MSRLSFSSRFSWLVVVFVCTCIGGLLPSGVVAQQVPSADQIEVFRSLPADQQRTILESMGGGPGRFGGAGGRGLRDRELEFPELVSRPGFGDDDDALYDRMGVEREPRLKALDTFLLSIEIREFKGQGQGVPQPATEPIQGPDGQIIAAPAAQTPTSMEKIERTESELQRLNDLRTRLLRRNPLTLDKWGILSLPELGAIPLAGLTAEETRQRLAAEPILSEFVVSVNFLPVKAVGARALKPFGYDLFDGVPSTFAPATDVPVPAEYVVGPGDVFEVQLIGNTKRRDALVVGRDGQLSFPELGPIPVAGMRFEEARALIEQRVREQLIGTQVGIQMGELRSIRIFVLGEAKIPGSYTVSGLSTITNALFVSGGVKKIGSLRNIELKRAGQTVARLDLYDLLLRGDTRADVRLLPGDVILIPPVGKLAGVAGEVQRPALYELKGESSARDLVALAGGLTAEADPALSTVDRIDAQRRRTVLAVDLAQASGEALALTNGDVVHVPTVRALVDDSVTVQGHVQRPGQFQYRPGIRISDVIPSLDELQPTADRHYVLIRRESLSTRRVEFVSVDLVSAIGQRGGSSDVVMAPRDQVYVFDKASGRERLLDPLLRELRLQSDFQRPTAEVGIGGRVNIPGQYPLEAGMRVSDLIRAGGSLNEAAYGGKAELTRHAIVDGESRQTELIEVDLARAVQGDPTANIELRPFDYLVVKELPLWASQEYVQIEGEVRFPGRYPIQRGETIRSVLNRAGGVTDFAFANGTVFTRESLKARERAQIDNLVKRLRTDLAQVSLMAAQEGKGDAAQALTVGNQLLENLRSAEPVGRLVINIDRAVEAKPGSLNDVILKDGDRLIVPRVTQEVTVIGEVQSPTSHLFSSNLGRDDYIEMSGGTTQRADKDRIYVVRANGSVEGGNGNRWFGGVGADIQPGDTIVVPLDAERTRALPLWTAVTTIIYNLAVAVAAVNSF